MSSIYRIPNHGTIEFLSGAKAASVAGLYAIGINKKIIEIKTEGDLKEVYPTGSYPESLDDIYNPVYPDAKPNRMGGYDQTAQWDGKMSSSLIGCPVMCYIKFKGGTYFDLTGQAITFPDVTFETVLITLTMGKNIKMTEITGRDSGSVKEYIGLKDWNVEIKAIVTASAPVNDRVESRNQDGVYPRANMEQIWQMLKAPVAIPVECWFLNQFDIRWLVIGDGVTIDQVEGEYEMQRINLPCFSDRPLIISIDR